MNKIVVSKTFQTCFTLFRYLAMLGCHSGQVPEGGFNCLWGQACSGQHLTVLDVTLAEPKVVRSVADLPAAETFVPMRIWGYYLLYVPKDTGDPEEPVILVAYDLRDGSTDPVIRVTVPRRERSKR